MGWGHQTRREIARAFKPGSLRAPQGFFHPLGLTRKAINWKNFFVCCDMWRSLSVDFNTKNGIHERKPWSAPMGSKSSSMTKNDSGIRVRRGGLHFAANAVYFRAYKAGDFQERSGDRLPPAGVSGRLPNFDRYSSSARFGKPLDRNQSSASHRAGRRGALRYRHAVGSKVHCELKFLAPGWSAGKTSA